MQSIPLSPLTVIPRVPEPGECFLSLDLSKIDNVYSALEVAFDLGFTPTLAVCHLQAAGEVHLLLANWKERDLVGNPTLFLKEADTLSELFNPEAVRYTWCTTRAVVAA